MEYSWRRSLSSLLKKRNMKVFFIGKKKHENTEKIDEDESQKKSNFETDNLDWDIDL